MNTQINKIKKGYRCKFEDIEVKSYSAVLRILKVIRKELKPKTPSQIK